MGIGNYAPVAEFNIMCDPEAAQIVFNLGKAPTNLNIVMVPLEVTHTAIVTSTVIETIITRCNRNNNGKASPIPRMCAQLMEYLTQSYDKKFGFENGPPLHDPCAVAYVINAELFETQYLNVEVESSSSLATGQTVCDIWETTGREQNVHVCKTMDVEGFWDMMLNAIVVASSQSICPDDEAVMGDSKRRVSMERRSTVASRLSYVEGTGILLPADEPPPVHRKSE